MDLIHKACGGLDVHKKTVMVCVRVLVDGKRLRKEVRRFGTMTRDLAALADWLERAGVSHVAMESTGIYWKPIYNLLEGRFTVLLVNAHHIKQVPGRKTDVRDCEWIAELLQHGLLRGSFVPPPQTRELRDLTRHRTQVTGERTRIANRIHKLLEDANIKLSSVASDILGVSGQRILKQIVEGNDDTEQMADLACGSLRGKIPELKPALEGRVTEHHRFMLGLLLEQFKHCERVLESLSKRIDVVLLRDEGEPSAAGSVAPLPYAKAVELLETIPGIKHVAAQTIVAEVGNRMEQFPTAAHLSSWAGISSGNDESAGKRRSGTTAKGNTWLRRILTQVAFAGAHTKGSYLSAQYRRLAARRGKKRAVIAVAHTVLVVIYHMLKKRTPYHDLGANFFDTLDPERLARHYVRRLEALGHKVILEPRPDAAA